MLCGKLGDGALFTDHDARVPRQKADDYLPRCPVVFSAHSLGILATVGAGVNFHT